MECIINIRIAAKFQYNLPYNFRKWNKHSVLRRQSRDTNRNMKVCYCFSHLHDWLIFCHVVISYKFTRFFIYFLFLSVEGPMLETLDYTIRIGSKPTILYFDSIGSIVSSWHQQWIMTKQGNLKPIDSIAKILNGYIFCYKATGLARAQGLVPVKFQYCTLSKQYCTKCAILHTKIGSAHTTMLRLQVQQFVARIKMRFH